MSWLRSPAACPRRCRRQETTVEGAARPVPSVLIKRWENETGGDGTETPPDETRKCLNLTVPLAVS